MIGEWGFSLLPFYLGIIPIFANNNYTLTLLFRGNFLDKFLNIFS